MTAALMLVLLLVTFLGIPQRGAYADGETTVSLGDEKVYAAKEVTITAKELRYAPGGDIQIDLGIEYSGKGIRFINIGELYVNNWLVPIAGESVYFLFPGLPQSITVRADNCDQALFELMQLDTVQTIKLNVWLYNEKNALISQSATKEIVNPEAPADFAQSYGEDAGKLLLDDDTIRITQMAYDPANFTAIVQIEKKQTSKWTKATLDALYNGCRASRTEVLFLDKGVHALVPFYGEEDCKRFAIEELDSMDVYATYYHSDRLQKPLMVTLAADDAAAAGERHAPSFSGEPIYEDAYCELYYAGAVSTYYDNADVIMLYCRNKTENKVLALFTAYDYILLDGDRVEATQANVNVYPLSVSAVILQARDSAYYDMSGFETVETTIGIYEIAGGYHKQLKTTGKLKLPLHGVVDPLVGNEAN